MSLKRAFDAVVSCIGLALISPLLLGISIAILAVDGRPVFFRQERVGRQGVVFEIVKFRTMKNNHGGLNVSSSGDSRITRTGVLLRRSKLDELPQLVNVIQGDMSLVGPRPEVPEYVAKWPSNLRPVILSVRPGITDPVSVEFRNEPELLDAADDPAEFYESELLPAKASKYAEYVRARSFIGDLRILCRTVATVVRD